MVVVGGASARSVFSNLRTGAGLLASPAVQIGAADSGFYLGASPTRLIMVFGGTAIGRFTNDTNLGLGTSALQGASMTGTLNTAIGRQALQLLSSGTENTSVGASTLRNITTATVCTALGAGALDADTASANTGLGAYALTATTSGGSNTAAGYRAGYRNVTGASNFFGGASVAASQKTSTEGVFIGADVAAGRYIQVTNASVANPTEITTAENHGLTTGDSVTLSDMSTTPATNATYTATVTGATTFTVPVNVTVGGAQTGWVSVPIALAVGNTIYCTVIGSIAGKRLRDNVSCTLVGRAAGTDLITGDYATCLGHSAGQHLTSGSYDTMLGDVAGLWCTTGAENTCVGTGAGVFEGTSNTQALRTADKCLFLGAWTSFTHATTQYEGAVAIGYRTTVNQAWTVAIGGSPGGSYALKVGIGTDAASERLHIVGNLKVDTGRILGCKSASSIATANDLTLTEGNYFDLSGNTQVNGIAIAGWTAGSIVTLQFASTPTVKHNTAASAGFASLKLAGAADFVAGTDDTLTLVYDGTYWREISRAVI